MSQSRREEAYNKIKELLRHYSDCLDVHQFNGDAALFAVRADEKGELGGAMQDFPPGAGLIILFGDMPAIPRGMELI